MYRNKRERKFNDLLTMFNESQKFLFVAGIVLTFLSQQKKLDTLVMD